MKKSYVFMIVIGVVLVLWGAMDFYNWASTGRQLLELYPDVSSVIDLVRYSFTSGIIKVILGVITAVAPCIMAKRAG